MATYIHIEEILIKDSKNHLKFSQHVFTNYEIYKIIYFST